MSKNESQETIFEINNKKLVFFINNADNAIFLIDANSKKRIQSIINLLSGVNSIRFMSYLCIKDCFVDFLSEHQNKADVVCIYDFVRVTSYDIVKTMNLSRELMRRVGILVLIMTTDLCDEIRYRYDNLYAYIMLDLDYNDDSYIPVKPIYSEDSRYFLTKGVRASQKRTAYLRDESNLTKVADYFHMLDRMRYEKYTENMNIKVLNAFHDVLDITVHSISESSENRAQEAKDIGDLYSDLYTTTAAWYVYKERYEEAFELFGELKKEINGSGKNIKAYLSAIQGQAYCCYLIKKYKDAVEILNHMLEDLEGEGELMWRIKTLNDIGTCQFMEDKPEEALYTWKKIQYIIEENHIEDFTREFRNTYNCTLAYAFQKSNPALYTEKWRKIGLEFARLDIQNTMEYIQYLFLNGWLLYKKGNLDMAASDINDARKIGKKLLPENSDIDSKMRGLLKRIDEDKMDTELVIPLLKQYKSPSGA